MSGALGGLLRASAGTRSGMGLEGHEGRNDGPSALPVDADEEKQRLIADAAERGIDPGEAVRLAEDVAVGEPRPDDYRFVDRRLATGYSLEDAEAIAMGEDPPSSAGS